MSDDQGWGQTGYGGHPLLKTPHLDAMAENGLRFERFYAAPVCSPTRASVLTGRTHNRTGVYAHGYPLRHQEKTLPEAMKAAGFATGHFGKWHINGLRGPGVPVLASDTHHPGTFGFDEWLTVTNYFDVDPLMSRRGTFEEFTGDSSEVIVAEALSFIRHQHQAGKRSFTVIWYGSPHRPFVASAEDRAPFSELDREGQEHHGELVAMDRSIGTLRKELSELGIAEHTLVWFNGDNGGLSPQRIGMDAVGGLRGYKGSVYEGGIRVPGVIEWPAGIPARITDFPAGVIDIFPTLANLLDLPRESMSPVIDGLSLAPLFRNDVTRRTTPLPFEFGDKTGVIDHDWKIIFDREHASFELYNLREDPKETRNLIGTEPEVAARMKQLATELADSIARSRQGLDYPEGEVVGGDPGRRFWAEDPAYEPYLDQLLEPSEESSETP